MRKNRFRLPVKLIVSVVLILCVIFIAAWSLIRTLRNLDYFEIKDIIVNGQVDKSDLSYLLGKDIFGIDLNKESRYILEQYPLYKKIRIIRVLPNRLFLDFVKRTPVAYIKLYRYFLVDEEMVVWSPANPLEQLDLPVILGLETKIFGPKSGRKYNIRELRVALGIIKEFRANRLLKDYSIKTVNMASGGSASIFLSENLEIRIGQEDIENRIEILTGFMNQVKNDLANIKYIDLRFKEPVIKFKAPNEKLRQR